MCSLSSSKNISNTRIWLIITARVIIEMGNHGRKAFIPNDGWVLSRNIMIRMIVCYMVGRGIDLNRESLLNIWMQWWATTISSSSTSTAIKLFIITNFQRKNWQWIWNIGTDFSAYCSIFCFPFGINTSSNHATPHYTFWYPSMESLCDWVLSTKVLNFHSCSFLKIAHQLSTNYWLFCI